MGDRKFTEHNTIIVSIILVTGTLVLGIPMQDAFATSISDCDGDSSADGERLILENDILDNDGNCLAITHNNVTLDCKGFMIDGIGNTGSGVFVTGNKVTIKNCTITDFLVGINLNGSEDSRITGNQATSNDWGIRLQNQSNGNFIVANNFDNNESVGIDIQGSQNRVSRNTADSNGGTGIFLNGELADNNTITANTANGNTNNGLEIQRGDSNKISRNIFNNNSDGILVADTFTQFNEISANTTNNNADVGIDAGSVGDNQYTRNNCSGNGDSGSEPTGLCSPQA